MISPNSIKLVRALHDKTVNDSIKWEQTIDDGVYQIAYPTFTIKIFQREGMNDIELVIQIFNENALLIDEITDADVTNSGNIFTGPGYHFMKEIYEKARAQALGVEEVINSILTQLDAGEQPSLGPSEEDIPF